MDTAFQLLIPMMGGLFLGLWLERNYGSSSLVTVILAIVGMFLGLGVLYKKAVLGVQGKRMQEKSGSSNPEELDKEESGTEKLDRERNDG